MFSGLGFLALHNYKKCMFNTNVAQKIDKHEKKTHWKTAALRLKPLNKTKHKQAFVLAEN